MGLQACLNCGKVINTGVAHLKERPFCQECAAFAEALNIGNPSTLAVFLYESDNDCVTWAGARLGFIVHKSTPRRGSRGALRFRVRMLDGSMWHGSGPTSNGTYMRLRRMKVRR